MIELIELFFAEVLSTEWMDIFAVKKIVQKEIIIELKNKTINVFD